MTVEGAASITVLGGGDEHSCAMTMTGAVYCWGSNVSGQIGDATIAHTPLARLGGDDDLKGLAALFASDAAAHITGQIVAVDGGASII